MVTRSRTSTRSTRSTTGAVHGGPSGTTSASRPSVSTHGRASDAGDRIINEHDESEPGSNEELYLVLRGRAVFELDGDRVDAPAGTLVFARPGVKRTAFAEEAGTTILALGGTPGKAVRAHRLGALGAAQAPLRGGRVRRGGRPRTRS